jgi:hypothetical protein
METYARELIPRLAEEGDFGELAEAQAAGTEALEAMLGEIAKLQADGMVGLGRQVSLRIAQYGEPVGFDGVLLVVAPKRSGSTWLFDLLLSPLGRGAVASGALRAVRDPRPSLSHASL